MPPRKGNNKKKEKRNSGTAHGSSLLHKRETKPNTVSYSSLRPRGVSVDAMLRLVTIKRRLMELHQRTTAKLQRPPALQQQQQQQMQQQPMANDAATTLAPSRPSVGCAVGTKT